MLEDIVDSNLLIIFENRLDNFLLCNRLPLTRHAILILLWILYRDWGLEVKAKKFKYINFRPQNRSSAAIDRSAISRLERSTRIFYHYTDSSIDSTWLDSNLLDPPIRSILGSL